MTNQMQMKKVQGVVLGCLLGAVGVAGCGAAAAEDVAYEDSYGSDYYYPADVAYAGVYAGYGAGYGLYFAVPTGVKSALPTVAHVVGPPRCAAPSRRPSVRR